MNNAQDSRNFLIVMTWQLSNASFNIQHQQKVWILDITYGKLNHTTLCKSVYNANNNFAKKSVSSLK